MGTDKERSKPEYTQNILEGLQWLGIDWDEEPMIQSERIAEHRNAIQTLLDRGLAYRCYASEDELEAMRENQRAANQAPRYDNRHRRPSRMFWVYSGFERSLSVSSMRNRN